jgi:septum formation protein
MLPRTAPQIILASSSIYRRELLSRVIQDFTCLSPDIDEAPLPGEQPMALAQRLAREKARKVATGHPEAVVIGSDQVAALDDQPLGKPGTVANAVQQLQRCSGQAVNFYTAVTVYRLEDNFKLEHVDVTTVQFRALGHEEIEAYVRREQPLDCAGSFKSEGLGVALFAAIKNNDPTALIGLPMIWLSNSLRQAGIKLL